MQIITNISFFVVTRIIENRLILLQKKDIMMPAFIDKSY